MSERRRRRRKPGWSTDANEIVSSLFAYGTFRRGEPARAMIDPHVAGSAPGTTRGRIYALPEGYPGLVDGPEGTVVGEILYLSDLASAFALLDAYEGGDYRRSLKEVASADGTHQWAWCYFLAEPSLATENDLIPDGDWLRWRHARPE